MEAAAMAENLGWGVTRRLTPRTFTRNFPTEARIFYGKFPGRVGRPGVSDRNAEALRSGGVRGEIRARDGGELTSFSMLNL